MSDLSPQQITEFLIDAKALIGQIESQGREHLAAMRLASGTMQERADGAEKKLHALDAQLKVMSQQLADLSANASTAFVTATEQAGGRLASALGQQMAGLASSQIVGAVQPIRAAAAAVSDAAQHVRSQLRTYMWSTTAAGVFGALLILALSVAGWLIVDLMKENAALTRRQAELTQRLSERVVPAAPAAATGATAATASEAAPARARPKSAVGR